MSTITRGLTVGVVLSAAAIGLASPASADLTPGSYTGTMLDGGATLQEGSKAFYTLTPCGPNCIHLAPPQGAGEDYHLQGNTWTSDNGKASIDNASLVMTVHAQETYVIQLTKNG